MAKRKATSANSPDPTALGRTYKRRLKKGDVVLGLTVMEYMRPSLAKLYAQSGMDFVYIEKEHGFFEGAEMTDFVLAARDNGLPAISKLGELNRAEVGRLLEAGVIGIQLPRTESRDDLATLIEYVKFPPTGSRAGAPGYGNTDYTLPDDHAAWLRKADQSTVIVAHIETALGFENIEEIASTPHLDVVYVGPYDFSISMGHPGEYDHPSVRNAMETILQVCRKRGVAFGTTASGVAAARRWIAKGCQYFEMETEIELISQGASAIVSAYRQLS